MLSDEAMKAAEKLIQTQMFAKGFKPNHELKFAVAQIIEDAMQPKTAELLSARKALAGVNAKVVDGQILVSFPDPEAFIAHNAQFPEEE